MTHMYGQSTASKNDKTEKLLYDIQIRVIDRTRLSNDPNLRKGNNDPQMVTLELLHLLFHFHLQPVQYYYYSDDGEREY